MTDELTSVCVIYIQATPRKSTRRPGLALNGALVQRREFAEPFRGRLELEHESPPRLSVPHRVVAP
jgi:hypothetical protein